jgi:hypothetical protein
MKPFPPRCAPYLLVAVVVVDILVGGAVLAAAVGVRAGHRAGVPVATGGGGSSGGEVRFRLGETGLVRLDGVPEGSLTVDGDSVPRRPPATGWSVTLTVNATATGGGSWAVNPFDFSVRGVDGRRYYPEVRAGDLHAATLDPDQTVNGTLTFAVPARHGDLVYAPHLGRALGCWRF